MKSHARSVPLRCVLFTLSLGLIFTAGVAHAKPPTCAIIANGPTSDATKSIVSLVEAKVSEKNEVQLVDRQSIDRLLQEQYLSKSGLIDADHAIATGKLLSADLLALLTPSSDGASILIFDAKTGVRLWDSATALTGEALADEFSRDVSAAVSKRMRALDSGAKVPVRTVCLQAVRNADLPRDQDAVARAAGNILMRRLASSPDIEVLERAQLARVTNERELTGIEQALIASAVSITPQIARSPAGDGIEVSAVFDQAGHERLTSRSSHAAHNDAEEIATAILPSLIESLKVAPPREATEADRIAESKRFIRECNQYWNHGEGAISLDAAEAAYALNPHDIHAATVRARATLLCGLVLTCQGDFTDPVRQIDLHFRLAEPGKQAEQRIPADQFMLALGFVRRAEDQLEAIEFGEYPHSPATAPSYPVHFTPLDDESLAVNTQMLLRDFICNMRREMFPDDLQFGRVSPMPLTGDEQTLFTDIQSAFRHRRFDLERPYVLQSVKSHAALFSYQEFLNGLLLDAQRTWPADGKAWTQDWALLIHEWVSLNQQYPRGSDSPFPPRNIARRRFPATTLMSSTTQPGRLPTTRRFTPTSRPARSPFTRVVKNDVPMPAALGSVALWQPAIEWGNTYNGYGPNMGPEEWQRLVDAYQELKSIPSYETDQMWRGITVKADPYIHPQEATVSNRPAAAPPAPPEDRKLHRSVVLHGDDQSPTTVGPGTIWPDSKLLIDFTTKDADRPSGTVVLPRYDASKKTVFALVEKNQENGEQSSVDLMAFNPIDGSYRVVSSLVTDDANHSGPVDLNITAMNRGTAALEDGYYVYCEPNSGVYLFPLSGGKAKEVPAAKFPTRYEQAATLLDGTLYVAVGDPGHEGYLLAYSLKDQTLRTLASSRRVAGGKSTATSPVNAVAPNAAASPFDDAAPLFVWHMQADAARHRIVLLVSNPGWPKGLSGWWEFSPAVGRFKSLLSFEPGVNPDITDDRVWVARSFDQRIAFSAPSTQPSVLNLADNAVAPLEPVPIVSGYVGLGARSPTDGPALAPPFTLNNGWIWGRFGRYRPATATTQPTGEANPEEVQSFDPIRPVSIQWGDWPTFLEPIDADHIIVGDVASLWSIHIPSNDPAALARVMQPSRPSNVAVDPIGGPPMGGTLPWKSVQTIYDTIRSLNVGEGSPIYMIGPQVAGDHVYVLASGGSKSRSLARLFKYSLSDGKRTELGQTSIESFATGFPDNRGEQAANSFTYAGSAIDDYFYYIADSTDNIYAFPLDGGKVRVIKCGPVGWARLECFAVLNGKLFACVAVPSPAVAGDSPMTPREATRFFRIDVAKGTRESLTLPDAPPDPDSRRRETPLDLRLLQADRRRNRVLFFLNREPKADPSVDGLWSCSADGMPQRVDPLAVWAQTGQRMGEKMFDWRAPIDGDQWLLLSENGLLRLDVSTLSIDRLWQVEPAGGAPLDASYHVQSPVAIFNGWLWDGVMRRTLLDGSQAQQLPFLRKMDTHNYAMMMRTILPIHDGRDLLLADNCGMWIVH